ncbi:excinuclease ABC subunit C, partial [Candidatus Dependentiae bacterium]
MHKTIQKLLPNLPGVYFFKNQAGEVVYIGKAKNLRHRVHSYFQKNNRDWKVTLILAEYHDLDFIITKNETEAMLLEADLIQQHKPPFNTVFKDGQPFLYILVTASKLPTLKIVRNKKEKGEYFGPFLHKTQARGVHRYIMNTIRLNVCNKKLETGCLDYHLGNCPGTCKPD